MLSWVSGFEPADRDEVALSFTLGSSEPNPNIRHAGEFMFYVLFFSVDKYESG